MSTLHPVRDLSTLAARGQKRDQLWMAVVALLSLSLLSACAAKFAIVREQRFRSEDTKENRIKLPLDEDSARKLLTFLQADGVYTREMPISKGDPYADSQYGPLLKALSDGTNLDTQTQKVTARFCEVATALCAHDLTRHFRGRRVVEDVIDARETDPVFPYPYAVSDGRFWWIFYHRKNDDAADRFRALLVTRMPTGKVANYGPAR
jgi:hypothetical protein